MFTDKQINISSTLGLHPNGTTDDLFQFVYALKRISSGDFKTAFNTPHHSKFKVDTWIQRTNGIHLHITILIFNEFKIHLKNWYGFHDSWFLYDTNFAFNQKPISYIEVHLHIHKLLCAMEIMGFEVSTSLKEINTEIRLIQSRKRPIKEKDTRVTHTYIMFDSSINLYKIGKSLEPLKREKTLQGEKPSIKLMYIIPKDIESYLHSKHHRQRVRGEWFNIRSTQLSSIIKIGNWTKVI